MLRERRLLCHLLLMGRATRSSETGLRRWSVGEPEFLAPFSFLRRMAQRKNKYQVEGV